MRKILAVFLLTPFALSAPGVDRESEYKLPEEEVSVEIRTIKFPKLPTKLNFSLPFAEAFPRFQTQQDEELGIGTDLSRRKNQKKPKHPTPTERPADNEGLWPWEPQGAQSSYLGYHMAYLVEVRWTGNNYNLTEPVKINHLPGDVVPVPFCFCKSKDKHNSSNKTKITGNQTSTQNQEDTKEKVDVDEDKKAESHLLDKKKDFLLSTLSHSHSQQTIPHFIH